MQTAEEQLFVSTDSSLHYYHLAEQKAVKEGPADSLFTIYDALVGFYQIQERQDREKHYAQLLLDAARDDYERGFATVALARALEKSDQIKCDSLYRAAEEIARRVDHPLLHLAVKANYGQYKLLRADFHGGISDLIEVTELQPAAFVTAQLYNKIANALHFVNRPELAEIYVHKAITLSAEKGYRYGQEMPLITLAGIRIDAGRYEEARTIIEGMIDTARLYEKPTLLVAGLLHLAKIEKQVGNLKAATLAIEKSKKYADHISKVSLSNLVNFEGQLLLARGQYGKVITAAKNIEQTVADKLLLPARQQAYANLASAYEKLEDHKNALAYFRQSRALEDSIFRTRQNYSFNELEARFNRKQQQQTLDLLDIQNELQAIRIRQQSRMLIFGGVGLVVILGLLAFLAQAIGKVRTQNTVISGALTEKQLLMQEIHHRVKNNLQLISSLLSLQSRYVDDPEAREVLRVGKDRVRSMSIIHQDLYRQENLTAVNVREYLGKLSRELLHSYELNPEQIHLKLDVAPIDLDVDTLVPLGLIVNELLTNACKYAFPSGRHGNICLRLWEDGDSLHLEIWDDGVGFKTEDIRQSAFGHKLIKTLLRQLDGEIRKTDQTGTHFILRFGNYKKF